MTQPNTEPTAHLSQDDVKRMYAAKDYGGIEKARTEGRLNNLLGVPAGQTELVSSALTLNPPTERTAA